MNKGDRVRLTMRAAQGLSRYYARRKSLPLKVDWFTRQGTIVSTSKGEAVVQWDGRRTVERYCRTALQPLITSEVSQEQTGDIDA